MQTIALTASQRIGYSAVVAQKQQADALLKQFLESALVENGGNLAEKWEFNGTEFRKNDPPQE